MRGADRANGKFERIIHQHWKAGNPPPLALTIISDFEQLALKFRVNVDQHSLLFHKPDRIKNVTKRNIKDCNSDFLTQ